MRTPSPITSARPAWFHWSILGGLAFGAGLAIAGVVWSALTVATGLASENWPTADGQMARATLIGQRASLQYRYTVDGALHVSDRIRIGDLVDAQGVGAAAIVARYPTGSRVAVRHDPADPSLATLTPGVGNGAWFLFGFALVAGVALVVTGVVYARAHAPSLRAAWATDDARSEPVWPGWVRSGMVGRLFLGVVGAVVFLFGPGLLFVVAGWFATLAASDAWPAAPGEIMVAEYRERCGYSRRSSYSGSCFDVIYRYNVAGETYLGRDLQITGNTGDRSQQMERYQVGAAAAVFYNPAHPEQAVLEREVAWGTVAAMLIVAVLAAPGGALVVWFVLARSRYFRMDAAAGAADATRSANRRGKSMKRRGKPNRRA